MPRPLKTEPVECSSIGCSGLVKPKRGRSKFCPLCRIQICKNTKRFSEARRIAIENDIKDPSLGVPVQAVFEERKPKKLNRSEKTRLTIWRHKAKSYFNAGNHTKGQEYADAADRLEFPQRFKDITA